jgi:hypothetical protein
MSVQIEAGLRHIRRTDPSLLHDATKFNFVAGTRRTSLVMKSRDTTCAVLKLLFAFR